MWFEPGSTFQYPILVIKMHLQNYKADWVFGCSIHNDNQTLIWVRAIFGNSTISLYSSKPRKWAFLHHHFIHTLATIWAHLPVFIVFPHILIERR